MGQGERVARRAREGWARRRWVAREGWRGAVGECESGLAVWGGAAVCVGRAVGRACGGCRQALSHSLRQFRNVWARAAN